MASRFDDSEWYPFLVRRLNNINDSLNKCLDLALEDVQFDNIPDKVKYINEQYYRPVYLIFDQFEELFILGSKEEQLECIANIKAILDANLQCKIILIMREEYIGRIYPYESMVPQLFKHRFRIETLGPAKIKEIIEKSFSSFNVELEVPVEKSLQLILEKLTGENNEIALPYLQVYMDILYRHEYKKHIGDRAVQEQYPIIPVTLQDIEDMGEIDDVLTRFIDEQQNQLFTRLKVKYPNLKEGTIGEILDSFITDEGTKKPVEIIREGSLISIPRADDLNLPKIDPAILQEIIESLEASRILRVEDNSVELAHDSLALLLERRRSDDQKILAQTRKRVMNGYQEFEDSGTYLNQKQVNAFSHLLPSLNLPQEVIQFIGESEKHAKAKENEEYILKQKAFEAEQQKKEARLVKEKLEAQKNAKSRLIIGLIAVGLLLPIIGYMAWNVSKSNKALKEKNILIGQEKEKLQELVKELKSVQVVLDTIANSNVVDSDLKELAEETSHSIDEVTEVRVVAPLEITKVNSIKTYLRNSTDSRTSFSVGNVVGFEIYLNLPKESEEITYRWRSPGGEIIRTKTKVMGRNTSVKGAKLFDLKGLNEVGIFKVEILDGNKMEIESFDIKVE